VVKVMAPMAKASESPMATVRLVPSGPKALRMGVPALSQMAAATTVPAAPATTVHDALLLETGGAPEMRHPW
jgi:hypothetical protein